MKTLFALLALSASLTIAQTPAFQAPTDEQVWGGTYWNCTPNPSASFDEHGPVNDGSGNYYGIGYFASFRCILYTGKSVQYRAACANILWDANGNIISVENFIREIQGNAFVVPCSP